MTGFIPAKRTKVIESTAPVSEGAEPFTATIVTSLTFAEIDSIPLNAEATWPSLFSAIAPYVVDWNALGRNSDTGEFEPLPPPAQAGPDVLRAVPAEISLFLAAKLKTAHLKQSGADTDSQPTRPEALRPEKSAD